jgi:anti-anti-sigma factor
MSEHFKLVQPIGILDSVSANNLRREIIDLIEHGVEIILLDLQNITSIDSSGIVALINTLKVVNAAQGQLFLCSLSKQVKMIFELSRMERMFQVYRDRQDFETRYAMNLK